MKAAPTVDGTLAALADPTRRAVIDLLRASPRRAGDLAQELDITPAALSRHLRVLRRKGLIAEQGLDEDARVRMYHLQPERFRELSHWLAEVESFWTLELVAFKKHAENRPRRRKQ